MNYEIQSAVTHNYAIYARICDEKRYDLIPRVFAADANLNYTLPAHSISCRGDEVGQHFEQFLVYCYWTQHLIAHPMVEVDGAQVRSTARVTATHLQRRIDGSMNRWIVRGSYHDTFRQFGDEWLIVRRDCFVMDSEGDFENENVKQYPDVAWAGRDVIG